MTSARMDFKDVKDVVGAYRGRSRTVLEYAITIKKLVVEAKTPGFSAGSWTPLARLVAVEDFQRVGPFKEVMRWPEYVDFLTNWATSSDWDCSFKHITETADLVFLELEERSVVGDFRSVVNSLSVYEFNDAGKITHIDLYLQMEMPNSDMLKSIEGEPISE